MANKIRYLIKIENEQKSSLYIVYQKDSIVDLFNIISPYISAIPSFSAAEVREYATIFGKLSIMSPSVTLNNIIKAAKDAKIPGFDEGE